MINFDDLNKAEDNINELFKLRDELISGSPFLNDMKSKILFYKKACTEMPDDANNFLSLIDAPVQSSLSLNPSNLNYSSVTGATGSFYSVTGATREIIKSYGSSHYNLINEYEALNKTEELIDAIKLIIQNYRPELQQYNPVGLLMDAKSAFAQWKAGAIDNSDLAKDIRAFQDIFNGLLGKAWVQQAYNPLPKKYPDFNWRKMSETLGKVGGGCKKTLQCSEGTDDRLHLDFTEILKKTKVVDAAEMERIFKEYIEHVYSIVYLINQDLMK